MPDDRVLSKALTIVAGVEVGHFRFLPGETAFPSLPGHLVNLHLGSPTRVVTRRDGRTWEGTEPPGTVEVYAAGTPTEQALRDTSEDVSVLLHDAFFRRVATAVGLDPDRVEVLDRFARHDPHTARLLLLLLPELESGGLGGALYVESLATALTVHLLRRHSSLDHRGDSCLGHEPGQALPPGALQMVTDYVEAHLAEPLALGDIAAVAGLSRRHFLRLFKASTGLSPHQYVIRRRVERARRLLCADHLSIAAVAQVCGFAHQQHLTRHFTRLLGVSPGRYRSSVSR